MQEESDRECLNHECRKRLTDEEAKKIIKRIGKVSNCQELQNLERKQRNLVLAKIKEYGFSIRRLERLTGLNRGVILRV